MLRAPWAKKIKQKGIIQNWRGVSVQKGYLFEEEREKELGRKTQTFQKSGKIWGKKEEPHLTEESETASMGEGDYRRQIGFAQR